MKEKEKKDLLKHINKDSKEFKSRLKELKSQLKEDQNLKKKILKPSKGKK